MMPRLPEPFTAMLRPVGRLRDAARLDPESLREHAGALVGAGYRPALVAAHDEGDRLRIVYLFIAADPDHRVELETVVPATAPEIPSLYAVAFPLGRFERELHDLFGIRPTGHPDLRNLVAHQHWPADWHPMRRGAGPPGPLADDAEPFPFLEVQGQGVYEIPVGPVHAGLIEPGHFRFSVVGETILRMKSRLWYVHKGIEGLFAGRRPSDAVELAERISGDTATGHCLAYCLAVEDALEWPVDPAIQRLRAVLLELERIYNHIADIGMLCNDVGYGILHAHAFRIREQLLRHNATVTGHRLLRGAITPGATDLRRLPDLGELDSIVADFDEVIELALANTTVVDRFSGTAVLDPRIAADLGTVGYVARASGIDIDARRDHPSVDLADGFGVAVQTAGDVMARFRVRVDEIHRSHELLRWLLDRHDTPVAQHSSEPSPRPRSHRSGVGIVEGWRGTIVHRVELDGNGMFTRVKIVDPSFLNWPALPYALADTIVPDFPLANKSFSLSYAGNDL
jgi:Ni,Fe-hydrogenase III large subunit/Ni,Fe-hydrogenase III component G